MYSLLLAFAPQNMHFLDGLDTNKLDPENYFEAETKARAEGALKVMLETPHKPHNGRRKGSAKRG